MESPKAFQLKWKKPLLPKTVCTSPTEQFMTTSDLEKLKFIRDSKEAIKKRSKRNSTCSQ